MYCRECGNKLPDGARFCSSCGTPVFADGTHGAFESKEGPAAHSVEPDVSVVGKNGPEIAHEKQEAADEMAEANLHRCDSICLKVCMAALIGIGFACAIGRLVLTTEVIGYCLMGTLILIEVVRTVAFWLMDEKGL